MPGLKYHLLFDRVLEGQGIICRGRKTTTVHKFMDRGARKWGPLHRVLDPKHDANMIRPWVASQVQRLGLIKQDTATDYVRVAWGHIVLDYVVTLEKDRLEGRHGKRPSDAGLDWDQVLRKAMNIYAREGFGKTYYRGPSRGLLERASHWRFGRGDKARS